MTTKTNRKKLTGAYSDKSPLIKAVALDADEQMVVYSTDGRAADLLHGAARCPRPRETRRAWR